MFDFLDRQTPEIARLLHQRATESAQHYLGLLLGELKERVAADFPKPMHWTSGDSVAFHFDELPDFSFIVTYMLDEPTLTIQAGGRFRGFQLQQTSGRWWTTIHKPLRNPIGPKAQRLAKRLEQQFGIKNATDVLDKFRQRFR